MSLRYASQLQVDLLPDEQINNRFEVVMPRLNIVPTSSTIGKITNTIGISNATKYSPIVEQIVFGPQNFKQGYTRTNTYYLGYPTDWANVSNIKLTMYLDVGNLAAMYIEAWKDKIFNKQYEFYYDQLNYKKDIAVIFYGIGGVSSSAVYYLRGCFPVNTSPWELAYSKDPKRLTLTQEFSVDRVELDDSIASKSIITTLASGNPLGIVTDQALAYANESVYLNEDNGVASFLKKTIF